MTDQEPPLPNSEGDPAHKDHDLWLLELGRLTRAAAQLATICFDMARIVGGVKEGAMYDDPLGGLQRRLEAIDSIELQELPAFLALLDSARRARNDVMHAFLVRDGLLRRTAAGGYDKDFYTIASLAEARSQLEDASRLGGQILHVNGGAALEAWRQRLV